MRRLMTLDVFTDRAFGGNPLGVVLDAEGLDDLALQAIAAEVGYSETTFVLPPHANSAATHRVRIFTPMTELPFAGHPTVGTAVALASLDPGHGGGRPVEFLFEQSAGLVPVTVRMTGPHSGGARFVAPGQWQRLDPVDPARVADALGIGSDMLSTAFAPTLCTHGSVKLTVGLTDAAVLADLDPTRPGVRDLPLQLGASLIYAFVYEGADETGLRRIEARSLAAAAGVLEDPATGSAAAALAGQLTAAAAADIEGTVILPIQIRQGHHMGRPGLLHAQGRAENGRVTRVEIAGDAVVMISGHLVL